jgi:chloride channel 3/4/5
MFELTGELEYVVPNMLAILIAKWVADALSRESVYDIAQGVLGHPFLDGEHAIDVVREHSFLMEALIPPQQTMEEITVVVEGDGCVGVHVLERKLQLLKRRGLIDAGLVLVEERAGGAMLRGYLSQTELEFGLERAHELRSSPRPLSSSSISTSSSLPRTLRIRLLPHQADHSPSPSTPELDLSPFVDRTPLTLSAKAPIEYAVEMFSKLGLRYLCIVQDGSGELVGVVLKKRLVGFLERVKEMGKDEWDRGGEIGRV